MLKKSVKERRRIIKKTSTEKEEPKKVKTSPLFTSRADKKPFTGGSRGRRILPSRRK